MKKAFSILILFVLIFLVYQWGIVFFKDNHEKKYDVSVGEKIFKVTEKFQKEYDNTYYLNIKHENDTYIYVLPNKFNKQQNIIKELRYFEKDNLKCIYPILLNEENTYIECTQDDKLYTETSLQDNSFIQEIITSLKEEGYHNIELNQPEEIVELASSKIYKNNLSKNHTITLWNYKGIEIINSNNQNVSYPLVFDKYENTHGYLVGKYYVIPVYTSSKVNEFTSLTVINVEDSKRTTINLGYTLSSDTYINGVVENKLYYMDPSNLIQLEINPSKNESRLIGDKDNGGQIYQGKWSTTNIYDLAKEKLYFTSYKKKPLTEKYKYHEIIETKSSYYFYNDTGIYQVSKNKIDSAILLLKVNKPNNVKVKSDEVYYVENDTLYRYTKIEGIKKILTNNELKYNLTNRIDIREKE